MVTMDSTKCLSLVEQKRIQWAREREELAGMCAPWGLPTREGERYRTCIKTRFVSSTKDLERQEQDEVCRSYDYSELQAKAARMGRKRSPSLPPIYNRPVPTCQDEELMRSSQQYENNIEQDDEREGETSGYASDSGGTSNERNNDYWKQQRQERYHRHDSWTNNTQTYHKVPRHLNKQAPWIPSNRRYATPDSVVSTPPCRLWSSGGSDEVNRLRWGDRGVGVGHLWEPTLHEPDSRLPQVHASGGATPSWLERGLSKISNCESSIGSSTQVLVINHGSPTQSLLSRELADSCDTISTPSQSECNRTFIRGQNAPLEADVLLERERKRQKALEHQNAIRLQLEERERTRKEERERRIREEKEEEERIKREQEIEKKRIEEEQRWVKEREDKEVRKAAAMREALENAEKKAREEKSRASRKHVLESIKDSSSAIAITDTHENKSWFDSNSTAESSVIGNTTSTIQNTTQVKDSVTNLCNDISVSNHGSKNVPREHEEVLRMHDGTQTGVETHSEALLIAAETIAMPADGLAVMLGNTTEKCSHDVLPAASGGVQLALLMSPSLQQPLVLDNRLLTPSKYRAMGHERGTQTDSDINTRSRGRWGKGKAYSQIKRKDRKKSASLERPHRGCKLPLRCRSQSQPTQPRMRLEDRPKWGVNRPETQYIKQSEKDPYYQRRLRQKLLRATLMGGGDTGTESDTASHGKPCHTRGSSDENSRSPSPHQRPRHSNNGNNNKNVYFHHRTRNFDRNANKLDKHEDRFLMSAAENEQLHSKDVLLRDRNYAVDIPRKQEQMVVPSPNINQHLTENTNNRKGSTRLLNRQNEMPVRICSDTKEQWSTAKDILLQLSSLKKGLLMKQQEWDTTRSHTPYSESSWKS
ncbi:hypothetical protein L798_11649 [Zootermopsis nevadensis]|uniref:CCDC66 domain-containing protein n=1 Tax=Zootermopsis nevadensis TaxID=136037 RepID=A0A067QW18_ZOONE|nr:hypothetical protein L798_11649 [Zootermopsis nevadensis]